MPNILIPSSPKWLHKNIVICCLGYIIYGLLLFGTQVRFRFKFYLGLSVTGEKLMAESQKWQKSILTERYRHTGASLSNTTFHNCRLFLIICLCALFSRIYLYYQQYLPDENLVNIFEQYVCGSKCTQAQIHSVRNTPQGSQAYAKNVN